MWLLYFAFPCVLAQFSVEPPPPTPASQTQPVEGWLPVRINHFDASNTDTFQMRYYYNSENANVTRNNIVIFVGGDWSISPGWVTGGLAYDLAQLAGAGLFYTEHRYYGTSRPFSDTRTEDLKYLNVDQALGDLAHFIRHVKSDEFENGLYRNASVALMGCSYAGSMATWMKLGYPHLVTTALSDSGPLHAQEDFPEYYEVVTEVLRNQGGERCVESVSEAVDMTLELLTSPTGIERVSSLFNTCTPLQTSSPLDRTTFFFFGIAVHFGSLVQNAVPGQIPAACNILTNSTLGDPVKRLGTWIAGQSSSRCIETRYQEVVASFTNTSYNSPDTTMRLWMYQTCSEYGWYQTTNGADHPLQSTIPLEYFHQMCSDFFPELFDEQLLRFGIDRTNLLFAGLTHLPDDVVSVAATHDPWSPMGPSAEHATPLAPVYVLPGVSHCRAIRPLGDSETTELEKVKSAVVRHMAELMVGPIPDGAATAAPTQLLVLVTCLPLALWHA